MWKDKSNRPILIFAALFILSIVCSFVPRTVKVILAGSHPKYEITGISSTSYFNFIPGVFYTYFGRPTCPDCTKFEPYLEQAAQRNHWDVYYFDTTYWKQDAQYERILSKYQVNSVPMLVKTVDGEIDAVYCYDGEPADRVAAHLDEIMPMDNDKTLFRVVSDGQFMNPNYPVQFDQRISGFTFLTMLMNTVFCVLFIKRLRSRKDRMAFLVLLGNSIWIMMIHVLNVKLGISFAAHYDAEADMTVLGALGTSTWLLATPALFLINIVLSLYGAVNSHER